MITTLLFIAHCYYMSFTGKVFIKRDMEWFFVILSEYILEIVMYCLTEIMKGY